jgi:hypothetical protein
LLAGLLPTITTNKKQHTGKTEGRGDRTGGKERGKVMNTEETQCAQLAVKNRRRQASHFFILAGGGEKKKMSSTRREKGT